MWISSNTKGVALALLTFAIALGLLALPLFFTTMLLAGPHSDLLPKFLQPAVLLASWATLLGVPTWLALRVYRWQIRRRSTMRGAA